MFFNKRIQGPLGSKCPVTGSQSQDFRNSFQANKKTQRPSTAKPNPKSFNDIEQKKLQPNKNVVLLKPRIPINTYKLHQTLFNIAKDEVLASSILQ